MMIISKLSVFGFTELYLTNMTLYLLIVFLFITSLLFNAIDQSTLAATPAYAMSVALIALVVSVVEKQIGKKGFEYFGFMFVIFMLILTANFLGATPFSFAPTSHVVITFFFSLLVWLMSIILGLNENGVDFYKIFVPDVPKAMLPFLVCIEIISYIIRVFSLAIRLAANITAGHVLLFTIAGFVVKLFKFNWFLAIAAFIVLILVFLLELGVAFLQAYVFLTLACIYFNDSLNLSH